MDYHTYNNAYTRWSYVDVPLVFSFPADHVVPGRQPRILLGMVEARSINNVKNIHAHTLTSHTIRCLAKLNTYEPSSEHPPNEGLCPLLFCFFFCFLGDASFFQYFVPLTFAFVFRGHCTFSFGMVCIFLPCDIKLDFLHQLF